MERLPGHRRKPLRACAPPDVRSGRPDQILGARVTLTAWAEDSEAELKKVLQEISASVSLKAEALPIVVLAKTSRERAEQIRDLLVRSGGTVSVEEVWVTREEAGSIRPRPVCPACGTEFEVDDRYRSCAELRRDWISIGAPWFSSFEPPPPNWHAIQRALLTHREASTVNVVPVQSQAAQPNFGWIVPPSFDWKAA